jgi:hypothetical protein
MEKKIIRIIVCMLLILSSLAIRIDNSPQILKAEEPDKYSPEISSISADPNTVGFGFNVSVNPTVFDNLSGVKLVKVNITFPDNTYGNYTMNNTQGNNYIYNLSNTWKTGRYNYTIWAIDNANNTNYSSQHSFNVSAEAKVNIATLKDEYTDNEYINITDPPTLPEDYCIVDRGLTWNEYYDSNKEDNILEAYTTPINYQNATNKWMPINNTINRLESIHPAYNYGYRTGNEKGLYNVYFKPNIQNSWPVAFAYNKSENPVTHVIRSKLVGVGYLDPAKDWSYKVLQQVQSSYAEINDNMITYENTFTGTDVTWTYSNIEIKEEITMSNTTKTLLQNHPPSEYNLNNESSYLVFITKLDHQNLYLYNNSDMITGNVTIYDDGVNFRDALGYIKSTLPIGYAYELYNESIMQKLVYRIIRFNGNTYLLSGLKISDLDTMTFPVVIDPTITVGSLTSDGYIYKSSSNYNTAWTSSTGTVSTTASYISIGQSKVATFPPDYRIYRGFLIFNTSALPSNAYIDNATLSLYKKDDYSSTDFYLTIQNGQPVYPHNPLQTGDYGKNHYSGNGGSLNTHYFINGRNNITLNNNTWITKGGTTKLCLRSDKDINGTAPTGNEYINIHSADASSGLNYAPKLIIHYRNQSKIQNTGSTDIKGYLLMQVEYFCEQLNEWFVADYTIDEDTPQVISAGNHLALDTIFNGLVNSSELPCNGTYRVYIAFRDVNGEVLNCSGTLMSHYYQFKVSCHGYPLGWRKVYVDGFGKGTNVATRGMAIFNNEVYIGTESFNKKKLFFQGCNGFSAGTSIAMSNGSYKNIEDLNVHDVVKAYDIYNKNYVDAEVTRVYNHYADESPNHFFTFNGHIQISPYQVLYVNDTLIEAEDAKIGDHLIDINCSNVTITSIQNISQKPVMYSFDITPVNDSSVLPLNLTFFAEDIQVYPWFGSGPQNDKYYYSEFEFIFPLFDRLATYFNKLALDIRVHASDGCEIWKYNQNTNVTTRVIGGVGTGHECAGFGDTENWVVGDMKVFNGKLYVGTWNSPDDGKGCEIWRYDGNQWVNVVGPYVSYWKGGFNNCENMAVTSMKVFKNKLYVGTMNFNWTCNGFCQVWRSGNGVDWEKVVDKGFRFIPNGAGANTKNAYAWCMEEFNNKLYIGTFNIPVGLDQGCQLFSSSTGNLNDWHLVPLKYGSGFNEPDKNYGIRRLVNWSDNYLYIGTATNAGQTGDPAEIEAFEIWRSTNPEIESYWDQMVGEDAPSWPAGAKDGIGNGSGNFMNKYAWSMIKSGSKLWVGTLNGQNDQNPKSQGCEVYSYNGTAWKPRVRDGYEKPNGFEEDEWWNMAARSMIEYTQNSGHVIVGTYSLKAPLNLFVTEHGCEIWIYR